MARNPLMGLADTGQAQAPDEREKRRRGRSLNETVVELLRESLGVDRTRSDGLARLAGGWDEHELREFERAVAPFERIDETSGDGYRS